MTGNRNMQPSDGSLDGKVVVVTGAARGQGRGEAEALVRAGARVIACDLAWPEVDDDGDDSSAGALLDRRVLDVSDPQQWADLAEWIGATYGTVNGLVNNAGIPLRSRIEEVQLDDWNRIFAVNVTGAMLGVQTLLPLMEQGASIVNIGSLAAVTAHPAVAYTASKWALRGLSRVLSMSLGDRGIRSNLVNPGFIQSAMTDVTPSAFRVGNIANTPVGRPGDIDDIVPVVLFLLSDSSSFITGAEIAVDGGQWAHAGAKLTFDLERESVAK